MKTCIYYELEQISADDVARARALAGPNAVEITAVGALWPAEIEGSPPERVMSHRDPRFLEQVMPWVDRLGKTLEQRVPEVAWRRGVSLPESARFDLLFSAAEAVQRWSVSSVIRERWNPERIVWYTGRPSPDPDLAELARGTRSPRIEVHLARPARSRGSVWWESAKLRFGPPLKRLGNIVRAVFHPPRWPKADWQVVFTDFFPNNVHALLPVARRLEEEHGVRVCWLAARDKVVRALAAQGVAAIDLPRMMSAAAHWRGRLSGSQRRGVLRGLQQLPTDVLVWNGAEEGREFFLAVLDRYLLRAWDENARWVEFHDAAWRALRPAVIVSATYSNGMGRAAAMTANQHQARAAYLEHGMFPAFPVYAWFCQDLIMMWGEWNRRHLIQCGVDERLIRVTGATIYDALFSTRPTGPPRAIPRPGEPLKVAYMASRTAGAVVTYAEAKATLVAMARAVRDLSGGQLTVKIHPGDTTGMVPEVLRDYPDFKVIQKGSARDVIAESDVVIVVSSTTGLEACAADKPLIVLNVSDSLVTVPYVEYGAALYVAPEAGDPAAELHRLLTNLQQDPAVASSLAQGRRALLDDLLNGGRGDAAREAASAVVQLLERPTQDDRTSAEPAASRAV